ncbi:hypothetical protein METBIDRAFT_79325 [Metschnikowia bicuspidata var. bicuspidata NRRL YB-4993]|uniref:ACB domain-containing protein n=1 Tax=Metschnikowia bicuspidata var. bicuspidata NRRL YB-4993 TaxID=869754 RepID=A0A1A0H7Z3_9ASCO|nr:hypothetical protein METBIDRAFT_79325 [Metschnikowia bicuspidata var. bicuspidata NRRL YB-4993]OBA20012.1 hypothetical protein METBIDRAFT_79325 [Metschnikowia bicuspidata var. bicuspidata NRRL YB-4993]
MSDSIDRVFVKAITTIRALSTRTNHGLLPRPPAENRIKLYGLYKQATEGNVQGIMSRPEGYTIEDEGAKKKWDAWKREEGLSKTQAKRRYILYLIETMRVYASGTPEARELLSELEYLWDQIKDMDSVDEEYAFPSSIPHFPHNITRLVISNVDQSDRFSTGTPWPMRSNYSALVLAQQHRSNLEQIYLHSRRSTQIWNNDISQQLRSIGPLSHATATKETGKPATFTGVSASVPTPNLEDFRAWQSQVNLIINKLSKESALTKQSTSQSQPHTPEKETDPREKLKQTVVYLLKRVGKGAFYLLRNFAISLFAVLFITWCVNRSVVVQRTIVKKQLQGKSQKELVINMAIDTDENKWFIRLLTLINKFVGFV